MARNALTLSVTPSRPGRAPNGAQERDVAHLEAIGKNTFGGTSSPPAAVRVEARVAGSTRIPAQRQPGTVCRPWSCLGTGSIPARLRRHLNVVHRMVTRPSRHSGMVTRRASTLHIPAPDEASHRVDDRRHDGHSRRRRPRSRRSSPAGPLATVNPSTVPAVRAHVVRLRAAHLAHRLPRPVVPPSVATTCRALAQVLAVGHTVHRAERRKRLGGHTVGLRRGGRWFVLPPLSGPAGHRLSLWGYNRRAESRPRPARLQLGGVVAAGQCIGRRCAGEDLRNAPGRTASGERLRIRVRAPDQHHVNGAGAQRPRLQRRRDVLGRPRVGTHQRQSLQPVPANPPWPGTRAQPAQRSRSGPAAVVPRVASSPGRRRPARCHRRASARAGRSRRPTRRREHGRPSPPRRMPSTRRSCRRRGRGREPCVPPTDGRAWWSTERRAAVAAAAAPPPACRSTPGQSPPRSPPTSRTGPRTAPPSGSTNGPTRTRRATRLLRLAPPPRRPDPGQRAPRTARSTGPTARRDRNR